MQIEKSRANFIIDASAEIAQLRAGLFELGFGFEYVAVCFAAGKDRDGETSSHLPGSVGMGRSDTDVAIVGVDIERRKMSCRGCCAREFGRVNLRLRCLIVRARRVGALEIDIHGLSSERLVWRFFGEHKLLAGRQSDDAGEGQLLLVIVGASGNKWLLPSLQFAPRPKSVDGGREARCLLVGGFVG